VIIWFDKSSRGREGAKAELCEKYAPASYVSWGKAGNWRMRREPI